MRTRLLLVALLASLSLSAVPFMSATAAIQPSAQTSVAAGVSGSAVVAEAEKFLGYPYSYTGDSPSTGFSCIGFVWYVYHQLGQNIPGTLASAMAAFPRVSESNLLPGDIVFFQNTWWAGVSHVAIYIGGGKIIHAENPQNGVTISSITNDSRDGSYWQQHYLVAERPWNGPAGSGGRGPFRHHRLHVLVVVASSLDLRSGPSTGDTVIEVLSRGTRVTVEGWRPAWVRVRTASGTLGWVRRSGVARGFGYQRRPGRHRRHLHSARRAAWARSRSIFVTGLRVHSAPSMQAPVIAGLSRGNRVGIILRTGAWDKIVMASGRVGWVLSRYVGQGGLVRHHRVHRLALVRRAGRTPLQAGVNLHASPGFRTGVVAVSNGAPVHVLRWDPGWARVRLSTGATGWVSRRFLGGVVRRAHGVHRLAVRFSGGIRVVGGVRIHDRPSVSAGVIAATTAGMRVRVLGYAGGFAHVVTSSGVNGWIESRFVGRSGGVRLSIHRGRRHAHLRGPVATATVRMHAVPGLRARVIGLVYRGTHVTVLRTIRGWDLVRLPNGATGYVDGAYIS